MSHRLPRGFTLIEILISIVLIGILVVTFTISAKQQRTKAHDAERKSDLERIKVALYDYYIDTGCYPQSLPTCGTSLKDGDMLYLDTVPCDPEGSDYAYQPEEGTSCPGNFKILTDLEIDYDTSIDKVGCRGGCGKECNYNYGLSSTNIKVYQDCVTEYACTPSGECAAFDDPELSRCPIVFDNDPTCGGGGLCNKQTTKCHDERGKYVPDKK